MESWNYYKNCFSCVTCKESKGLLYARRCSPTTNAQCACMPGRYCFMEFKNGCKDCALYTKCRQGLGVSRQGTATLNVKCEKCPEGTFSDSVSHTEVCKPHSFCDERHIISKGNATSDTVCKPAASTKPSATLTTKPETTVVPVTTAVKTTFHEHTESSTAATLLGSTNESPNWTKSEVPLNTGPENQLAVISGAVAGIFLLLIVIVLMVLCKRVSKKATLQDCPKVDANGNCKTNSDNTNLCYLQNQRLSALSSQNNSVFSRTEMPAKISALATATLSDICSRHYLFFSLTLRCPSLCLFCPT
ncbi:hypothetical protein WMY93_011167 [Mugilogobius chulae]|uniref:TNFR-Cys domain-containing protein n=1 Tax=Mugilogobius chulae TaxID=88201 RepID=A0AAW0PCY9_9GOBI